MFRSIGFPELLVIAVVFVLILWPWAKIFSKAGYSAWLCLTVYIPVVNLIVLLWFAFAEWPVLKRLRQTAPGSQIPEPAMANPGPVTAKVAAFCTNCGNALTTTGKFCGVCGSSSVQ